MNMRNIAFKIFSAGIFMVTVLAAAGISRAEAASLYFSPNSDTYFLGRTFNISVYVSSVGAPINAVQGTISFPTDKMQVISLSKSGSVLNLWVQDPSFSNRDGTINFAGVSVNPGFQGTVGKIITITFRANGAGRSALSFISGSVLANDGSGTNILSSMGTAFINLTEAPQGAAETPSGISQPVITSVPKMDNNSWYNADSVEFSWKLPSGITGVEYGISDSPDYQFAKISKSLVSSASYDLKQFNDGIWHFSARFKKGADWGPASTKSFHLDRTPPDIFSIIRQDTDPTNEQPAFSWTASDQSSGIASYQVKIGDGDWFDAKAIESSSSYILPKQSPTYSRILSVRAYDNAGNFRESSIEFHVIPKTGWHAWWYKALAFLNDWGWILIITIILAVAGLYLLIFRILKWRGGFKSELKEFKNELRRDLKRLEDQLQKESEKGMEIDLKPAHIEKAKKSLEREIEHIEKDIEEELKNIDKMSDK